MGDFILAGAGAARRPWKGQLYADDLSAGVANASGPQRLIDAICVHSLRWVCTLNVPSRTWWSSGLLPPGSVLQRSPHRP